MRESDDVHLFIPGPVSVAPSVAAAACQPIVPHYGSQFVALYNRCLERLQQVFETDHDLYLIVGPGSAALDVALTSSLNDRSRVLVLVNGWFSHRLAQMCQAHCAEIEIFEEASGQPIDVDRAVDRVQAKPSLDAVVWVHDETSTGVLNPVEPIAQAAKAAGVLSILDGVSSLGGTELRVNKWGVDLCVTVANKCLASVPGLSAISVSPYAWEIIDANGGRSGWYLDLRVWRQSRQSWCDWHPYPTTVPPGLVSALDASLGEILHEGLSKRFERTLSAARRVREGLREMGFEMFVEEAHASPTVTAVCPHAQLPADQMIRLLRQRRGICIAGGIDELHGVILRIGHMGRAIDTVEVELLLSSVQELLEQTPDQTVSR